MTILNTLLYNFATGMQSIIHIEKWIIYKLIDLFSQMNSCLPAEQVFFYFISS